MNIYNRFAYLYDELMDDFDYEYWFKYIENIFIKYDKSPNSILEMACGTGSLSYYLGQKEYKLTCFDISEEMLSIAYNKLIDFHNVEIFHQNMIDFNFNKKFDAILSICDSINYVYNEKDLFSVFKNVWNHLEEDGIFIFDISSYYKLKKVIGNNTFVEDRDNIFYSWENYFNEKDKICNFYLTFFVRQNEEEYIRFDESHKQKAYKIDEIVKLLKEVGFKRIDYYKGFSFNRPSFNSERVNFVVKK